MKRKNSKKIEPEVWGLTGGIGSGKSTVARLFAEAGIPVVDADQLTRELSSEGGAAHAALLRRFGTADRAQLRALVFKDLEARQDLEAILHPLIQVESQRRFAELHRPGRPVIYEATLLVESGRYLDLAGLIVVEAPLAARKARLRERPGLEPEVIDRIIASQATDAERRAVADVIIENGGTLAELGAIVRELLVAREWA